MKWKDLSLKERKQIYDSVRANNPDATYLDIKQQFDSIPAYQDGKGKTINKADLPPEYRTGTPEYFERQRKISGAVNTVQPEAYITPAGYIKDAVNFIEDLGKGDYTGAAIDAALNLIPWGVGKGIKKLKSKVGRIIEGTEVDGVSVHSFAPTQTKKKTRKKTEEDYDSEFSEVLRKDRNSKKYQQEISRTIEQAIFPVADGLAGSRKIQDFDSGKEYITNTYLNYLANSNNTYSSAELRKMGLFDAAGSRSYLLNPTEAKSHMLTLKRSLKDSGKITNWSTPVDENMIMEILMPLGGAGFVGHELNKE